MGIFSTKKTIHVASTVYNMAGDISDRPSYLKSSVVSAVLGDPKKFVGETVVQAHLNGPGIRQRGVQRWAVNNYPLGTPTASITKIYQLDPQDVVNEIPKNANEIIHIQNAFVDVADTFYIAEKHVIDNHPELYNTDWIMDTDEDTGDIIIEYEDNSIETISASGFNPSDLYVVAYFRRFLEDYTGPLVTGSVQTGNPDNSSFSLVSSNDTLIDPIVLTETVHVLKEYSDSQPDEETTTTTDTNSSFTENVSVYSKTEYLGYNEIEDRIEERTTTRTVWKDYSIQETVDVQTETEDMGTYTVTTTTTTTTEYLQTDYTYRDDTQMKYSNETVSALEMFLYVIGDGNATLDALVEELNVDLGEFYPFVPLRLNNKAIDHDDFDDMYNDVKKAYKKMTTAKIGDVLESLEDNEDIGDIDYVYMMYGAPLNTEEDSSKRYIYEFIDNLIQYQTMSYADYITYKGAAQLRFEYDEALAAWEEAQSEPGNSGYNTPKPEYVPPATKQLFLFRINSQDSRVSSFNQSIEWVTVNKETHAGLFEVDGKQGDVKIETAPSDIVTVSITREPETGNVIKQTETIPVYKITYQTEVDEYVTLTVYGMIHRNHVYGGKSVVIDSSAAFADNDESGFLFPMHAPTIKKLSLVDATQMATVNSFLIMNSYEIVKTRWYERGIFQIIIVIVVVILTAIIAPQLVGASVGLLGSNIAVGTALGFTGTAAIVAGAVANAIVAIIVTQIISGVATSIFGDKIGAIIAAVVSFIVTGGFASISSGSLTINWASMMRIDNIMALTSTAANAYAGWVNGETLEIQQEMSNMMEEYEQKFDELEDLTKELGIDQGYINPLMFTEFTQSDELYPESSDSFLNRTTMVATDFIDLSFAMIYDFTEMTTTLDKG